MIHSARPTVSPVANIVFALNLFCFEKWGRTTCAKTVITTGRDSGSSSWIKKRQWSSTIHMASFTVLPIVNIIPIEESCLLYLTFETTTFLWRARKTLLQIEIWNCYCYCNTSFILGGRLRGIYKNCTKFVLIFFLRPEINLIQTKMQTAGTDGHI